MRRIAGALLLLLWAQIALAQPVVSISKPYGVVDADSKYYFSQGNEIMTVKVDSKDGVTIQKLRSDNLSFQKIKLYDDFPKMSVVEKVTEFDGKYYLFYSYWDGEQEQLFSREINFAKGEFAGAGVKRLSVKQKIAGSLARAGFYRLNVVDKFDFYFSTDSTRLLVQYRLRPEVKSDAKSFDVIGMGVFDKELKAAWTREVKMPYSERKMNNLDYVVDRKGNAYIVTMVYGDDSTEEIGADGNPNYSIEILKMTSDGKDLLKYPVALADKFVKTLWIYENPKGFLVCGGFYNNGKNADNADGILMFRLSDEGKVLDVMTYEIPLEILNQYASAKTQRKNERKDEKEKAEFQDLVLKEIRFAKDGSMLLISEQEFVKEHSSYSNGRSSVYFTYHYNDMLIAKISSSGKLEWMKKLPKRQTGGRGIGSMSYKYLRSGNSHYFLFLDNEKNRDLSVDKLPANHTDGQGGFLTAYKVDDINASIEKVYVLDTRDIKGEEVFQFMTSRIIPTGSKEYVFEAYKKKKEDILIKVKM
jgi:hypothetical protein